MKIQRPKKANVLMAVATVLIIAAAFFALRTHDATPVTSEANQVGSSQEGDETHSGAAFDSSPNSPAAARGDEINDAFSDPNQDEVNERKIDARNLETIRSCLKRPKIGEGVEAKLETVLQELAAGDPKAAGRADLIETLEVERENGKHQRLSISPKTSEKTSNQWDIGDQRLRVFDVDAEGLPIPVAVPSDLQTDSVGKAIATFTNGVNVVDRNSHYTKRLSGMTASIEEDVDGVRQISITLEGGKAGAKKTMLGCAWLENAELDCRCL